MKGFVDSVTLLQRWCKRFLQVKRPGLKLRTYSLDTSKVNAGTLRLVHEASLQPARERVGQADGDCAGNFHLCLR